ncbi:YhgE/Pip domain-containing protein [Neobacillus dielmonensis]|uniref:YhgE/Pip domain-containing protein n=1 Tax=Neobacillus dielmonensis TaxID=1347369 RepID=UPI0005A6C10F|nr:YhgE/Pip domain-containing protein [Neobacillus dielmonensis]
MKNVLLKEELSTIFSNKKILIPILAVLFIPVLYAGMFLWAFWDPYAKLDQLPVAIVNEDKGAAMDGQQLELGNDLVKKLTKSDQFKFQTVSKKEGYKQLNNQKYYMLIEIPKDFSENATTLLDNNPKKLELLYVPNESFNFLSGQIGGTAAEKIKTAVAEQVTKTYAETMFDKVTDLAEGIGQASDGAGELSSGAVELADGSKDLNDGLATLAEKSIEFNQGVKQASSGTQQLSSGSDELKTGLEKADSSMPKLINGTNQVYAGTEQMKTTLPAEIAKGINNQMAGSVTELNTGINDFKTQLSDTLISEMADSMILQQTSTMDQLAAALKNYGVNEQIVDGVIAGAKAKIPAKEVVEQQISTELAPQLNGAFGQFQTAVNQKLGSSTSGLEQKLASQTNPYFDKLIAGISAVNDGQKELQQGVHQLYLGSQSLTNGANDLTSGMDKLASGADQLTNGSNQLAEGSNQLADGTTKISDGAKELADKLADGANEASKVNANDKTYDMMSKPVKLDTESVNHVPNYGTGFTPYFLSLGLFVGALILSIVFPIAEPVIKPANGLNWFVSKFSILAVMGIIQALLADAIILTALDLQVQSVPRFILFTIFTSLTFVTLIQLLVTALKDVGRFIAILILIFQLTTSAGTFPLETIPNFLQHFNALLPMTYTVRGFKAVVSSGDFSYMWHNTSILVGYIVIFAICTISFLTIKFKSSYNKPIEN